ncbi:MAG: hypothetical protein JWP25_1718 [Bradyrhizobium sp.]|nr:hypothetical protein [Bradyrhizobium sp.]
MDQSVKDTSICIVDDTGRIVVNDTFLMIGFLIRPSNREFHLQ